MIKYTMNFNGMFASFCQVHTQEAYANESLALPENILDILSKRSIIPVFMFLIEGRLPEKDLLILIKRTGCFL